MDNNIKEDILKAAFTAFMKYGIRSVSIDDICNDLYISKKTFYIYFRQKEELVSCVLDSFREEHKMCQKEMPVNENGNVIDKIMLMREVVLSGQSQKKHEKFFYDLVKYYPVLFEGFMQDQRQFTIKLICSQLEEGIKESLFRSDVNQFFLSQFLTFEVKFFMDMSAKQPRKYNRSEAISFLIDSYLRIACNEKGLKYYESLI